MKKIALSLVALAALSTASFASQRGYDLRETQYWTTSGSSEASAVASSPAINAFAVIGVARETAFERVSRLSIENVRGRH